MDLHIYHRYDIFSLDEINSLAKDRIAQKDVFVATDEILLNTLQSSDDLYIISGLSSDNINKWFYVPINNSNEITYDGNYIIIPPVKIDLRAISDVKLYLEVMGISNISRLNINVKSIYRDLSVPIFACHSFEKNDLSN